MLQQRSRDPHGDPHAGASEAPLRGLHAARSVAAWTAGDDRQDHARPPAHVVIPPTTALPMDRLLAGMDPGDAFLLLEGARLPGLRAALQASGCEHWCLLCPDLDNPLRDGAPYLMRLRHAGHPAAPPAFLRGVPAAVLLLPYQPISGAALRTHLRRWMRAPMREGRSRLFRFFDPAGLVAGLPQLSDEARRAFLAPLGRVRIASPTGGGTLQFTAAGAVEGEPAATWTGASVTRAGHRRRS